MADYTPVFAPGRIVTLTASAAVTGGQPLEVSGSGTVAPVTVTANPSTKVIGVAADDTAVNGRVTVYSRGFVHESVAGNSITAGEQVGSALTGDPAGSQVHTIAPSAAPPVGNEVNAARGVLGIALTSAANPNKVRWMEI